MSGTPQETNATRKPVVLLPACNRPSTSGQMRHTVGDKYVAAVRLAGCLPLVVASAQPDELDALLELADGVLLTGSPTNVHPRHYAEQVADPSLPLDPLRDAWTLPLIPRLLAHGVPLFAICRGFQEVNVALGGSLHQAVHALPGLHDHRGAKGVPDEVAYALAHTVNVVPGGVLDGLLGPDCFEVNSLHGQGVNRLAPGLRVEARAPDGLVEAFTAPGAPAFNLCVQWHPEWQAADNRVSARMLEAFGAACRTRAQSRDRRRDIHR